MLVAGSCCEAELWHLRGPPDSRVCAQLLMPHVSDLSPRGTARSGACHRAAQTQSSLRKLRKLVCVRRPGGARSPSKTGVNALMAHPATASAYPGRVLLFRQRIPPCKSCDGRVGCPTSEKCMTRISVCIPVILIVAGYLFAGDGLRAMPRVQSIGDTHVVLAKAKPKSTKPGGHSRSTSQRADKAGKKTGTVHSGVSSIMIKQ